MSFIDRIYFSKISDVKIKFDVETLARFLIFGVFVSMTRAFALTNLFEFILLLLFIFNPTLRKLGLNAIRDPRVFWVFVFWAWVGLSGIWSIAPSEEIFLDWWSWRKLLLVPMCFALFQTDSDKRVLIQVGLSILGLWLFISWFVYFDIINVGRSAIGIIENHATQGVMFAFGAVGSTLLGLHTSPSKLRVILFLLAISFILNLLIVTTGRSGYLALFAMASTAIFFYLRSRSWLVLGLLSILIATIIFSFDKPRGRIFLGFEEIVAEITNQEAPSSSLGMRVNLWNHTTAVIEENWVLGTGAGAFKYFYADQVVGLESWRSIVADDPHQQYMHIWAEYGLVGLIFFLTAIGAWIRYLVISVDLDVFVILGLSVLIATMVNSLFNGHFSAFVEGRLVWISIAAFLNGKLRQIRVKP